ncbi:MAG: ParA family protein [Leptolyngbya sp. PLA2]|nr:ParA family protein [Leptolyngbya sp. PL-A2]MCQ3941294.1 ParA family protein [cyanobacterium CYA1]MCZ7632834.1 AAA family ATPase [Phycisphaerales bacterium]MDL1904406.1 ParA family protein [Synechococcales cyanobacterium CNB]GIK19094.1 MAG: chromosome partitioning protein ParA [Planctomycetota bacterium]
MQPPEGCRVVALMNQKGGVGKTTTAVNLSAALARTGLRTLLIDLDPQAHATLHLGVDPRTLDGSVYDALLDPSIDPSSLVHRIAENLFVLPAVTDLAAAEPELATVNDRQHRLASTIRRLAPAYDAILIDCPPSLGLLTVNALAAAHEVLIPMQAHFLALQGVSKLLETVSAISASVNPRLRVLGVVLCMHDANTTHTQEVVADLEAFFEQHRGTALPWADARVFRPPVRRNIKLAECPSFGQTVFDYAPGAAGAADYLALADAIVRTWHDSSEQGDGGTPEVRVVVSPASPLATERPA